MLRTTCLSLQLKGIQTPQSTRLFQSGRQDMTQSDQTAPRPGNSERGTWQASGPARIYSGWTQRIHTPKPGFWPHQPLTAEIGCWRFQSLHAVCVLTMRLSGLLSDWDWDARSTNLMTVYVVNWWMQEGITLCRANTDQDAWHAITRSTIWYTAPWFVPTFHRSKNLRGCWGQTINDQMATRSFHGRPEETSHGTCRLSTPLQHRTFKPRLCLRRCHGDRVRAQDCEVYGTLEYIMLLSNNFLDVWTNQRSRPLLPGWTRSPNSWLQRGCEGNRTSTSAYFGDHPTVQFHFVSWQHVRDNARSADQDFTFYNL